MNEYEITIEASMVGVYQAESLEEAQRIAVEEATDAYNRLKGRYGVEVVDVEEVK